jgi:hypothetical protein
MGPKEGRPAHILEATQNARGTTAATVQPANSIRTAARRSCEWAGRGARGALDSPSRGWRADDKHLTGRSSDAKVTRDPGRGRSTAAVPRFGGVPDLMRVTACNNDGAASGGVLRTPRRRQTILSSYSNGPHPRPWLGLSAGVGSRGRKTPGAARTRGAARKPRPGEDHPHGLAHGAKHG